MSIVKFFDSSEIRFVDHPTGKYGFGIVADDLGDILEHSNSRQMVAAIDDDWKGVSNVDTPGGTQSMTVVWEPGVYELLSVSRKPKAKPFKKWLYEEVLPSIRKTGSYSVIPSQPPVQNRALEASRQVKEIHQNIVDISPRLAQFLIDTCVNDLIGNKLPGDAPQLRGVAEIAKEMGFPVNEKNRGNLGRFVKSQLKHLFQTEKRLCNGVMADVAAYPDIPEVRARISKFFA